MARGSTMGMKRITFSVEAETGSDVYVAGDFNGWKTDDRKLVDIFGIQDDIARQVVNALSLMISTDSNAVLDRVPTESFEAYQYYLQGRDYLRGEYTDTRLDSARQLFDMAIKIDSAFAAAYAGLCDTYLALYQRQRAAEFFEEAERACHRGLTLDARAVGVHASLGSLYRLSGQHAKAASEYEMAISLYDRNIDAYLGLADTYAKRDNLDKAEEIYRRAIDLQPGYWRAHLRMGYFLYYAGRIAEAITYFGQVVNLAPDNAAGHLNLGSSYFLLGDFGSAASSWERSIELEPSPLVYMNVGSSYFFLGKFEKAAEMYKQATQLAPDDFEAWGALGDAYRYAGGKEALAADAYAKAIELGESMRSINPSAAMIIAPLAQYYAHAGHSARATELIAEAIDLAPEDYYVQYFSAVTHTSLGDYGEAVAAIEKAVELGYPANLLRQDAGLATIMENPRVLALIDGDGQ